MEFVWGDSLEKRLAAANAPLLESDVLKWAIQLCDALDYLHTRQPPIIFRDLKPSNVMVTHAGLVKLVDFGIARTYKMGKKRDTVAMGSENYAAPEQWGKGQTDARSDVYALGATMYHLLANMAPTPAFLPSEPLPLGNYNGAVSKRVIALIEKAMARDRAKRFQSAPEMRAALIAAHPGAYASPVSSTAPRPAPQPVAVPAPIKAEPKPAPAVQPAHTQPQTAPPTPQPAPGQPQPAVRLSSNPPPAGQPARRVGAPTVPVRAVCPVVIPSCRSRRLCCVSSAGARGLGDACGAQPMLLGRASEAGLPARFRHDLLRRWRLCVASSCAHHPGPRRLLYRRRGQQQRHNAQRATTRPIAPTSCAAATDQGRPGCDSVRTK
jgi:hypothetical protein